MKMKNFESILKLIYQGDPAGERLLKQTVARVVRRCPASEYSVEGCWNDGVVDQIVNDVWANLVQRGLDRAWFLAGAGEKRILTSINNFVFNIMLSNAPQEQRAFYNQVVVQFRKDKRLAKKKMARSTFYMGHSVWKNTAKDLSSKTREELFRFWHEKIAWPKMVNGKSIKANIRRELFYKMLELADEWVLDAHFYHNFRELVNFPKPGSGFFSSNYGGSLNETDEASDEWDDNAPTNFYRLFCNYYKADEDHDKITQTLKNHGKDWDEMLDRLLRGYNDGARRFIYYYCVENERQTLAAKKAGRSAAFATETKKRFRDDLMTLSVELDELPVMYRYLSAWLSNSLFQETVN